VPQGHKDSQLLLTRGGLTVTQDGGICVSDKRIEKRFILLAYILIAWSEGFHCNVSIHTYNMLWSYSPPLLLHY
jgi:hypothetical protein